MKIQFCMKILRKVKKFRCHGNCSHGDLEILVTLTHIFLLGNFNQF